MTRKRFIKLLMAFGASRNEAQRLADKANKDNCCYGIAFGPCFHKMMLDRFHKEMFEDGYSIPITIKYEYKGSDNNA